MAAINVDYIAWIITVLGAINSNHTFIFDLNYLLWKLKTSKRQVISFLLETKHKVFRFKTKPIPRMLVHDAKRSLKILVTNVQLSVTFATGWAPKNMGGSLFSSFGVFGGLRGLCFQDTRDILFN